MCEEVSSHKVSQKLYLLMDELQHADVWVTEGPRMGETHQTDSAYCRESGKECPVPLLSLTV